MHDGMGTGQEVRRGRGLIDTLWQSNKLACPFFFSSTHLFVRITHIERGVEEVRGSCRRAKNGLGEEIHHHNLQ